MKRILRVACGLGSRNRFNREGPDLPMQNMDIHLNATKGRELDVIKQQSYLGAESGICESTALYK
jgi:hypothetical protein